LQKEVETKMPETEPQPEQVAEEKQADAQVEQQEEVKPGNS